MLNYNQITGQIALSTRCTVGCFKRIKDDKSFSWRADEWFACAAKLWNTDTCCAIWLLRKHHKPNHARIMTNIGNQINAPKINSFEIIIINLWWCRGFVFFRLESINFSLQRSAWCWIALLNRVSNPFWKCQMMAANHKLFADAIFHFKLSTNRSWNGKYTLGTRMKRLHISANDCFHHHGIEYKTLLKSLEYGRFKT